MGDALTAFCSVFSLLGIRLLFFSQKAVTFGSVVLLGTVSATLAQTISGSAALAGGAARLTSMINETCAAGELPPDASAREVAATAASFVWLNIFGP